MRVITFSRFFPAYHPKAGQPTFFVEKIWAHLILSGRLSYQDCESAFSANWAVGLLSIFEVGKIIDANTPKIHTIRAGNRWEEGDQFSPRIWSGRPYNSKQIAFAPVLTVQKTQKFIREKLPGAYDAIYCQIGEYVADMEDVSLTAKNDGLELSDFDSWFSKNDKFGGQIIYF